MVYQYPIISPTLYYFTSENNLKLFYITGRECLFKNEFLLF